MAVSKDNSWSKEQMAWEYENKDYLHDRVLYRKKFHAKPPVMVGSCLDVDHRHCEFCWATFADAEDCLHEGYYEPDSRSWICDKCYARLQPLFHWTVK